MYICLISWTKAGYQMLTFAEALFYKWCSSLKNRRKVGLRQWTGFHCFPSLRRAAPALISIFLLSFCFRYHKKKWFMNIGNKTSSAPLVDQLAVSPSWSTLNKLDWSQRSLFLTSMFVLWYQSSFLYSARTLWERFEDIWKDLLIITYILLIYRIPY